MNLSELNERRRLALIENIFKVDLKSRGYRRCLRRYPVEGERLTVTKDGVIDVSFDLSYASDYKEDAYRWCYVDIFISESNIALPDQLKPVFTRVMNSRRKRLFWRHRSLVRIIDMDLAAQYIVRMEAELRQLMVEAGIQACRDERPEKD